MKRVVLSAALMLLVAVPSARAATYPTTVSQGWAGFVVRQSGTQFVAVEGRWTQPLIVCDHPRTSAAFWVGLGGAAVDSRKLEQVGTSADCSDRFLPSASAWYQLYPAPAVDIPLRVRPGDRLFSRVAVHGTRVALQFRNLSTGRSFARRLRMRAPETDSAEWIVEAPAACVVFCSQLSLSDFGQVEFTNVAATTAAHTGPVADPAWSPQAVEMTDRSGCRPLPSLREDGRSIEIDC